jgi:hypothetical protein
MKWLGIGFNNNTHTMPGASIFMFFDDQLFQYDSTGFTIPKLVQPIAFNSIKDGDFWEHQIEFSVRMNESRFENNTQKILLAYNTNAKPISPTQFEKHTSTFVRDRNLFTTGNLRKQN